jgi:hypothetical protein
VIRLGRVGVLLLVAWSGVFGMPRAALAARGPVEVPKVAAGDSDGDGLPEISSSGVAGGPCACRCPIAGAATGAEAAGIEVAGETRSALVVCGTRLAAGVDPDVPDAGARPEVSARLRLNPNGLGRGGPAG